jgi:hypothetical protein
MTEQENYLKELETARQDIVEYVRTFLGDGMTDVELDAKHYNVAIDKALAKYRQRSSNAVEESFGFLTLEIDQNELILPKEVMSVREVFRRSIGSRTGGGDGGSLFEPFNLAYTNTYLMSGSMMGGLATYDAFAGYQKLVGRMFGSYIEFLWKPTTHILNILQRPFAQGEQILVQTYNYRPDWVLLQDPYAKQWIRDYTLATSKEMLGEARSKFGSIAGPSSPVTLNGTALKSEAKEMIEKLDKELEMLVPGGSGYYFVIG